LSVSEQNTFDELWSAKAKEMMRNTLFLDEIRDFVRMWLQQKDTDDFGGEMTASEFKQELLKELEK